MSIETKLNNALKSKNETIINSVFEEIYQKYGKIVYLRLFEYLGKKDVVEDLLQDVFVSFFNNLNKIKLNNIKYYLLVSAKNKALDYLKSQNNDLIIDSNYVYDNEEIIESKTSIEFNELIFKMKSILTKEEIDIVLKHIVDGYSFKKIAKEQSKSINSVLTKYYRALKKVKEVYKSEK